jgi:hypothetical protein
MYEKIHLKMSKLCRLERKKKNIKFWEDENIFLFVWTKIEICYILRDEKLVFTPELNKKKTKCSIMSMKSQLQITTN